MGIPRRAMHASCESPWHSLAKHCILDTCFLRTVPFRGMLLTPQGGPRCLAPTAHPIPVYLMVFSTFLCRAFTAHYLYTPRSFDIPPCRFHSAPIACHSQRWLPFLPTKLHISSISASPACSMSTTISSGLRVRSTAVFTDSGTVSFFQTPPDVVVKFQRIDIVDVILRLVLRPRVAYQREIKG